MPKTRILLREASPTAARAAGLANSKNTLTVAREEPEKVMLLAYRIEPNDGKIVQRLLLPDHAERETTFEV